MASRREYEMMFKLNAEMGGSYSATMTKASGSITSLQKDIQALSRQQGDISAYQKQQQAVESTKSKMELLQQQYDNIQREMQETGTYSSDLQNKLLAKQRQIDKTKESLEGQTQKLDEMGAALRSAGVNTTHLETESKHLGEQLRDLKLDQISATQAADEFGEAGASAFSAAGEALASAGIVAGLKQVYDSFMACVSVAADFEETMSAVEALSGANVQEMAALSEEAKALGATTKFTAAEAAEAMTYMGMAGWDAQQMISSMDGVLQLAAASGEDLGQVSDIVTDSLTAFGLTAADTAHFSDVLAVAATKSNTTVTAMGETFKQAAPIAGALGYSVEDTAIAVGLMANSGIKASMAGTTLKNTFNGLLEGATLTAEAFGDYEFSALRADGTMKSLSETTNELRGYFDQMTEAEKVSNAQTIAGMRGYAGLLAILNSTEADYNSLSASINNCTGAAQKMANVRMDNMNGQVTLMKSAWDGLKTSIGEQFTPAMTGLYKIFTDILTKVNEFVKANPGLVKAFAAATAVIGTVVAALAAYKVAAGAAAAASALLTASIPGLNVIMGVTAAVAGLTAVVVGFSSAAKNTSEDVLAMQRATEEMNQCIEASAQAISDAKAAYEDAAYTTLASAETANAYIDKLEELDKKTVLSGEEQQQYQSYLALLVQTMPELSSQISQTTDEYGRTVYTLNTSTAALRNNTEEWKRNAMVQAMQEQYKAAMAAQAEILVEQQKNVIKLTQSQEKENRLRAEASVLYRDYIDLQERAEELSADASRASEYLEIEAALGPARDAWASVAAEADNAAEAARGYQENIDNSADAAAEAREEIELMTQAMEGVTGATANANTTSAEFNDLYNNMLGSIKSVEEAYTEVQAAAYESISSQYSLWDYAEKAIGMNISSINTNLGSQISYWEDYNANLAALQGRVGDIEGLDEVIASFADESKNSAEAVAGMASATDDQLKETVRLYQEREAAMKEAASNIAEFSVSLTEEADKWAQQMEDWIKGMDLSDEAIDAAQKTVQGLIDGANGKLPSVQAAYAKIGQAMRNGINAHIDTQSISYLDGFATGTANAHQGWAMVGEQGPELMYFQGGERVLPASKTEAVLTHASVGGATISVAPVYQISGSMNTDELEAILQAHDAGLRNLILDTVEEAQQDAQRRAYV